MCAYFLCTKVEECLLQARTFVKMNLSEDALDAIEEALEAIRSEIRKMDEYFESLYQKQSGEKGEREVIG